jgi:hypothetical protein
MERVVARLQRGEDADRFHTARIFGSDSPPQTG